MKRRVNIRAHDQTHAARRRFLSTLNRERHDVEDTVQDVLLTVLALKVATHRALKSLRRALTQRKQRAVIKTFDLIDVLAADARRVRRLPPPLIRAALWLSLVAIVFLLLAVGNGVRPDLAQRVAQTGFVIGVAASFATGLLAAVASFVINLPDRSRGWALLPVLALLVWLSSVGYGCLTHWVDIGPGGVQIGETARSSITVVLVSLPLSLVMFAMLRQGATLSPTTLSLTGSLAVAAMIATAMSLFHRLDATVLILIWNLGTAALIVALGGTLGRRMLGAAAQPR